MENKVLRLEKTSKTFIKKNHNSLFNDIIKYDETTSLIFKWGELLWHYLNDINDIPHCICGDEVKFLSPKQGYREFCSKKCMYSSDDVKKKRRNTCTKKYGVDNPSKSPKIRNKIEETNIKKFGTKYPLMNGEKYETFKINFIDKYGVDNPSKLDFVKEKRKNTMVDKYGVETYPKHESFNLKTKQTKLKNNGDENYNNRDKFKETMMIKYGTISYNNIEQIKHTNFGKYGSEFYTQTEEYKKEMIKLNILKNEKYFNSCGIKLMEFISSDRVILKCDECNDEYETTKQLFRKRIHNNEIPCVNCNPFNYSKTENEVKEFIKSLNIDYIDNDKKLLNGKEIDIYIPELKIGIEFNGLYWHSDLFKDKNYHYNKMIECKDKNIHLIQIWEDQWFFKQNIVKSIILNKLNLITTKIYARKCEIKIVNYNDSKEFLNKNHIQGNCNSKIRIGLFHNKELVSLMTFGALRKNLGQINTLGSYELLRFCSKLNIVVVGGASKLFKNFIKNYNYNKIISYSLCDYNKGDFYIKMGFGQIHFTGPNYFYIKNKTRYNRYNFRKNILVEEGYDGNLTEREIMSNRGYDRIYDSGSIKFVLNKI